MTTPTLLMVLLGVLVVALLAAQFALHRDRARQAVLDRAGGNDDSLPVEAPRGRAGDRVAGWLARRAPTSWRPPKEVADRIVHAGYDGPSAPVVYAVIRLASMALFPLSAVLFMPRNDLLKFAGVLVLAIAVGLLVPPAVLGHMAESRQEKIRRALPDSMDLLVVCVEAGISLDAGILRVAREMALLHPDLARELMIVNRRVNAGMSRDQAMHGLWERTGVEELRGLAANLIQSEKWGTSIATVLRVYAESLRKKRKQAAEKKAATAALKMLLPLGLFIFPTIFIAIIGSAMIQIYNMLATLNH
ncbi:MAG TPA: type II secretion system F family protein [Gemmatimonadaceae bacterium]|nr:type II secretion system F family protein [Gemmatimonadaceae bacterium]